MDAGAWALAIGTTAVAVAAAAGLFVSLRRRRPLPRDGLRRAALTVSILLLLAGSVALAALAQAPDLDAGWAWLGVPLLVALAGMALPRSDWAAWALLASAVVLPVAVLITVAIGVVTGAGDDWWTTSAGDPVPADQVALGSLLGVVILYCLPAVAVALLLRLAATPPSSPAPGWYPDPSGASGWLRFWDGGSWTVDTRRAGAATGPAIPEQAPRSGDWTRPPQSTRRA